MRWWASSRRRTAAPEFFALWTFAARLAAVIGPVTYGLFTLVTSGNHRVSMAVTAIFFVGGLLCLRRVDLSRGGAASRAVTPPEPGR